APARMFEAGSSGLRLKECAVDGRSCSSPRAPAFERASGLRFDSTVATATSIASGRPVSLAAVLNAPRKRAGTGHCPRVDVGPGCAAAARVDLASVALPTTPAATPEATATRVRTKSRRIER